MIPKACFWAQSPCRASQQTSRLWIQKLTTNKDRITIDELACIIELSVTASISLSLAALKKYILDLKKWIPYFSISSRHLPLLSTTWVVTFWYLNLHVYVPTVSAVSSPILSFDEMVGLENWWMVMELMFMFRFFSAWWLRRTPSLYQWIRIWFRLRLKARYTSCSDDSRSTDVLQNRVNDFL